MEADVVEREFTMRLSGCRRFYAALTILRYAAALRLVSPERARVLALRCGGLLRLSPAN